MEVKDAVQVLTALAQENRLGVMRLLIALAPGGVPAGELAQHLGAPASTTSFHLSVLERADLVVSTRERRQVVYAARMATLRALLVFLTEACCAGRPELCADIARLLPAVPEER
jgi:DNA-binding transcriptional ArsR family regulator